MTERKINQNGFTLLELLVVVAIIGLMAVIALVFLTSARRSGRNTKRVADVKQIAQGLELFLNECGGYPALPPAASAITITNSRAIYSGTAASCGATDQTFGANGVLPKGGIGAKHTASSGEIMFVSQLPTAPTPVDDGSLTAGNKCSEINDQTGVKWGEYSYVSFAPGDSTHYWLYFCLGQETGKLTAGRYIMTERGIIKYSGDLFP